MVATDETKVVFRYMSFANLFLFSFIFFFSAVFFRILLKSFQNFKNLLPNNNLESCAIYGAGSSGVSLLNSIKISKSYNVKYFIDDDVSKIGRTISGLKIHASQILESRKEIPSTVFLSIPSASSFKARIIKEKILKLNIKLINIDLGDSLFKKKILTSTLPADNKLSIALKTKDKESNIFKNKTILISGAGGSIGQELFFQLSELEPKEIIALDFNEYNLSELKNNTDNLETNVKFSFYLINLCNEKNLLSILSKHSLDFVFHAAAYKHVDIVENNPIEGFSNNILSLVNLLDATKKISNLNFTFISTDKAVNAVNYMGLSKRLGEIMTVSMNRVNTSAKYNCVRFGNVIGSSGSLLPLLKKQMINGGPLTITHPEATRYFMTISDAVNLTIESAKFKHNSEVYVLNMGKAVNIYNLAKQLLEDNDLSLKNKDNNGDIEIKIIGLRPGEKIHEELFFKDRVINTSHDKIFKEKYTEFMNYDQIAEIKSFFHASSEKTIDQINKILKKHIPEQK